MSTQDELLNMPTPYWKQQTRTYYHAVASDGSQAVRGSGQDKYTHAVVQTSPMYKGELSWATFHGSLQLAKRQLTSNINWTKKSNRDETYEVVELKKVTAKEVRQIKKSANEAHKAYLKSRMPIN